MCFTNWRVSKGKKDCVTHVKTYRLIKRHRGRPLSSSPTGRGENVGSAGRPGATRLWRLFVFWAICIIWRKRKMFSLQKHEVRDGYSRHSGPTTPLPQEKHNRGKKIATRTQAWREAPVTWAMTRCNQAECLSSLWKLPGQAVLDSRAFLSIVEHCRAFSRIDALVDNCRELRHLSSKNARPTAHKLVHWSKAPAGRQTW